MPVRVQTLRSSVKLQRPAAGSREPGETFVNFADLQFGVVDPGKNAVDLVAVRYFSAATDYVLGNFVIQAGVMYRAKGAVPAGVFNASQWDSIGTAADLAGKEPSIPLGTVSQYWRGDKTWQTLDKASVGLSNADNTSDINKPVSTAQQAAINLKANIDSPSLTGIPRAPTAALSTYTTQLATTQFVGTEMGTALVSKADINSPTFLGDPKAPTPATADNDTSIATTAFVKAQGYIGPDAPNDGTQYVRKNLAWSPVSVPPGTFIGDAPPASPTNGQEWWQSSTGMMFIFYVDAGGGAGQWVQTNAAAQPVIDDAGKIDWFARQTPPVGWLKANGALVSRTTYSRLFTAIQTTFGVGDGSTTFGLPDLRGEFVRSWADDRAVDTGRAFGSAQADAYLNHAHTASNASGTFDMRSDNTGADLIYTSSGIVAAPGAGGSVARAAVTLAAAAGATRVTVLPVTTVNASTTGSNETRPRNVALLACIRY